MKKRYYVTIIRKLKEGIKPSVNHDNVLEYVTMNLNRLDAVKNALEDFEQYYDKDSYMVSITVGE